MLAGKVVLNMTYEGLILKRTWSIRTVNIRIALEIWSWIYFGECDVSIRTVVVNIYDVDVRDWLE